MIDEGVTIVDEAIQQVRDLSFELRPSLLDDLGLTAALRWYADRYAQRTGILIAHVGCFWDSPQCPYRPDRWAKDVSINGVKMRKLLIDRMGKNLVPNKFPGEPGHFAASQASY